jgi:hypothetical protein
LVETVSSFFGGLGDMYSWCSRNRRLVCSYF